MVPECGPAPAGRNDLVSNAGHNVLAIREDACARLAISRVRQGFGWRAFDNDRSMGGLLLLKQAERHKDCYNRASAQPKAAQQQLANTVATQQLHSRSSHNVTTKRPQLSHNHVRNPDIIML
jgi:hypothetical protein